MGIILGANFSETVKRMGVSISVSERNNLIQVSQETMTKGLQHGQVRITNIGKTQRLI